MTASDLWPAASSGTMGLPRGQPGDEHPDDQLHGDQLPGDQLTEDVSVRIRAGAG